MAAIATKTAEVAIHGGQGVRQQFWHVDMNGAATVELGVGLTNLIGLGSIPIVGGGGTSTLSLDEVVGTSSGMGTVSSNITLDCPTAGTAGEYFVTVTGR